MQIGHKREAERSARCAWSRAPPPALEAGGTALSDVDAMSSRYGATPRRFPFWSNLVWARVPCAPPQKGLSYITRGSVGGSPWGAAGWRFRAALVFPPIPGNAQQPAA